METGLAHFPVTNVSRYVHRLFAHTLTLGSENDYEKLIND